MTEKVAPGQRLIARGFGIVFAVTSVAGGFR
jgi:hypothetical protein